MSIVAALDKVLFFNASSKYSVLRMKTEDSSVPTEARSPYRYHDHLIRFTAVGIELPQTDTVKIEMDGEWKDGKYGLQLQVDHWQEIVPPTLEGVRNYRRCILLKNVCRRSSGVRCGESITELLQSGLKCAFFISSQISASVRATGWGNTRSPFVTCTFFSSRKPMRVIQVRRTS